MKRLTMLALLIATMLTSTACGTPAPASTATPEPATSTPVATDTPEPTSTPTEPPTNTPTPTLDITATAAVKATEAADGIMDQLDDLLEDTGISYKEGNLLWKQEEPIELKLDSPKGPIFKVVDEKLTAANFVIKADIKWETTGIILCGLAFRADEDDVKNGKQYQFWMMRFSGLPYWSIFFGDNGRLKNDLTKPKFSKALNLENGSKNEVVLAIVKEQMTVFINGVRQGKFYDYSKQASDGTIAFLIDEDSGESTCTVENGWLWELPEE